MAEDIVPALLEKIQQDFQAAFDGDETVKAIYQAIEAGTATYAQANEFAVRVGELLADAYGANLSGAVLPDGRMYYNIAQRILTPTFRRNYELITGVTTSVQETLNAAAGIGIKAQVPAFNRDKLDGIINRVSSEASFDDVSWILQEPVVNFLQSVVDDAIQENAEFQSKAGLKPKIIRRAVGKCCAWCSNLAGTYSYPDVPKDVYRRHENCRCTVEYDPGDGKKKTVHAPGDAAQKRAQEKARQERIAKADALQQAQERDTMTVSGRHDKVVVQAVQSGEVALAIKETRQKWHLIDSDEYVPGRSYLKGTLEDAQALVDKYAGTGEPKFTSKGKWSNKEVVTADHVIGVNVNPRTGEETETKRFVIHYSKNGTHIVPTKEEDVQ